MKCKYCDAPEISNQGRQLCEKCYMYLNRQGRLSEYPQKDLFEIRLVEKYGGEIVSDFELCLYDLNTSQTKVSQKYGFTRERARQIFNNLFDDNYQETRAWLRLLAERKGRLISRHPTTKLINAPYNSTAWKGFKAEALVFGKLKELGFAVSFPLRQSPYDLIVDRLKIEVKNAVKPYGPYGNNNVTYYRGCLSLSELKTADFVVIYITPTSEFYIIPMSQIGSGGIYIRTTPTNTRGTYLKHTNYQEYKDAWHLLKVA